MDYIIDCVTIVYGNVGFVVVFIGVPIIAWLMFERRSHDRLLWWTSLVVIATTFHAAERHRTIRVRCDSLESRIEAIEKSRAEPPYTEVDDQNDTHTSRQRDAEQ